MDRWFVSIGGWVVGWMVRCVRWLNGWIHELVDVYMIGMVVLDIYLSVISTWMFLNIKESEFVVIVATTDVCHHIKYLSVYWWSSLLLVFSILTTYLFSTVTGILIFAESDLLSQMDMRIFGKLLCDVFWWSYMTL